MVVRLSVIFLALALATDALAQANRAQREQVAAATAAAVRGLTEAVARETLAPGVTVGTLLDRTGGHANFADVLRRAEQIGGPRWVDQTCQVRLDISGARVAQALVNIAAAQPKKSPIPPDVLAVKVKDWDKRTFSATGSSTGAAEIEHVRPGGGGGAWLGVSDEARRRAVAAAKDDAIEAALASVGDVRLPSGRTAREALAEPKTREAMTAWLSQRPVTEVVFRDDLNVGVSLAAPAGEFFEAFRDALRSAEPDAPAWEQVRGEFVKRVTTPTGTASAGGGASTTARYPSPRLPALPPAWTNRQVEAQGAAAGGGSKLKCARAAEAEAAKALVAQLDELTLADGTTIGQARADDPRLRDAVDRAVAAHARTYKVEYDSDGSARVHVQLDLRDVWEELRSAR